MLSLMKFEAIATTSAGLAFSLGKPDGEGVVTADESFENSRVIVNATGLPVAADLENGYGDAPEDCAATILRAAAVGLVGGSIEDATGRSDKPIYDFELSVARVKAAVKAARSLPFPFMLTARAENLLHGINDLKNTIRRLEAYADAGADVLFAPGLTNRADIEAVVKAVAPKPVNVIVVGGLAVVSLNEFGDMGVRRISIGSAFARAAYGAFLASAEEVVKKGTFGFVGTSLPYASINDMMRG
jgi:2-methylisocitrate lyase-like PEP mutase family enzyme